MSDHPLGRLAALPPGYVEAAELIAGFDRCLLVGFSRLGPDQTAALQALARAFVGTPLAGPLTAAIDGLGRGEFHEGHFAVLAAARAALQGAQYDALRKQVCEALGRPFDPAAGVADQPPADGRFAVWGESTRHWLMELALAGFKQLEAATLAPFTVTLEAMEAEPKAARQAALLAGLQDELLQALPVAALPEVPAFRWADLWTRAMLGSFRAAADSDGEAVAGTFYPLGVEYRGHASFAAYLVYGVLETGEAPQAVRVSLTTYTVSALRGRELWRSFADDFRGLIQALSGPNAVEVRDATLLPGRDLLWDGKAKHGKPFDPLDRAAEWFAPGAESAPSVAPAAALDRHPLQLAEPIYLGEYTAADTEVSLNGGPSLPLLPAAFAPWAEVTPEVVGKSERMAALLRFDAGRWYVQPLAVGRGGKKPVVVVNGQAAWEAVSAKRKKDTLGILKERASRLLRKKS
jgi:hypothetical protein